MGKAEDNYRKLVTHISKKDVKKMTSKEFWFVKEWLDTLYKQDNI